MALAPQSDAIIRVRDVTVQFGNTRILDGLNLFGLEFELVGNDVAEAAPETANPDDPTSPTKSEMTN